MGEKIFNMIENNIKVLIISHNESKIIDGNLLFKSEKQTSFIYKKQNKTKYQANHTMFSLFHVGSHVLFEGWYHLLQKLSGRSVNPGLQMFGQSISGNVDMDGNGYTGRVIPDWMEA